MRTLKSLHRLGWVVALSATTTGALPVNGTYDVAIAGGGTAGLYLGLRLASQHPQASVIVLEAGGSTATDARALIPENEGALVSTTYDWNFTTIPQAALYQNGTIQAPRGRTLGGSAALNYLIYARPSKTEIDAYSSILGLQGWDWASVLPAFEAAEDFTDPPANEAATLTVDDSVHGRTGLIKGSMEKAPYSLYTDYVIPALASLGVPKPVDRTAGNTTGCGFVPQSVDAALYQRSWSGSAYAKLESSLPNLQVETGVLVEKILWSSPSRATSSQASGLQYRDVSSNKVMSVSAQRIVLSAGAIQTPPLLEASGIGDASILQLLDIPTVLSLPSVGTQSVDHLTYSGSFSFSTDPSFNNTLAQNFQDHASPSRFLSAEDYAFASSLLSNDSYRPQETNNATWQMVNYLFEQDEPFIEYGWFYGFMQAYLLHPLSQGSVHLTSAVNTDGKSLKLDTGYNSAKIRLDNGTEFSFDLWMLAKAVQYYATSLPATEAMKSIGASFSLDASLPFSEFQEKVFEGLGSGDHQTGGAVMLPQDQGGVVDENFKIYGTENVFVVDASVLPVSPGQHIQGMVYAIAERAAGVLGVSL